MNRLNTFAPTKNQPSTDLNDPYNPEKGYTGGWWGTVTTRHCPVCLGVLLRDYWIDRAEESVGKYGVRSTRAIIDTHRLECPQCGRKVGTHPSIVPVQGGSDE